MIVNGPGAVLLANETPQDPACSWMCYRGLITVIFRGFTCLVPGSIHPSKRVSSLVVRSADSFLGALEPWSVARLSPIHASYLLRQAALAALLLG